MDICTQEGKGFQKISILLALGLVFMPFHPYFWSVHGEEYVVNIQPETEVVCR